MVTVRHCSIDVSFYVFRAYVSYIESQDSASICPRRLLSSQDVKTFQYAISHDYWFQYFIDDLPAWGKHYSWIQKRCGIAYILPGNHVPKDNVLIIVFTSTSGYLGMVGKKDKEKPDQASLFTHQKFEFEYNGDQIISAKVTPENLVLLANSQAGVHIDFTYSVHWKATTKEFKSRFERYLDSDFFENKV